MENIVVRGPCSQSGFGRMLIGTIKVLQAAGYDPKFVQLNVHKGQHRKGFNDATLKALDSISIKEDDPIIKDSTLIDVGSLIYMLTVPLPECKRKIIYTLTETVGIHRDYVYTLNNKYDEVWTGSNFNKVGFSTSGVTNTVKVLPLYIDLDLFCPGVEPLKIKNKRGFNFIVNMDMSYRKGLHLLLPAYTDTFEPDDDVALILKLSNGNFGRENANLVIDPLNEMLYKMDIKNTPHAPILLFLDFLEDSLMPNFYATGEYHISSHLAEGFGLTIAESMGVGLPQITSRCSAPLDFMHRKCGYWIDLDENKPTQPIKDPSLLQRDPRYKGQDIFNVSIDSLKEHMRHVYTNQSELKQKAEESRKRVEKKLGLERLVGLVKDYLDIEEEKIEL